MPGADYQLTKLLGLRPSVKRLMMYQQSCFTRDTVLRLAKDLAENNAGACVLVVCSEITVVTFRGSSDTHLDSLVRQALFGDGAAAVIVGVDPDVSVERPLFQLGGILRNPNGTYTRSFQLPCIPAAPASIVATKDIPINPQHQTWLPTHLPREALHSSSTTPKLSLVMYCNSGGFVFMSAAFTRTHNSCNGLAAEIVAVAVSVEYCLVPEHRLPA
ncbi:hypothetical protein RJ640_004276 [Escallonia rubra]|uniref:Chalcone synthase n=1 Tax=Escallonia rubra TaxID=112253 RepID=A0AA88RMB6_9ASTE|nr:hypothetical protein RJ640_004276 [Escallonia rubra]